MKYLVIVAPSGTGKSTLIKRLFEDFKNLSWSISHTTRPMRPGEVNGRDYFFVSVKEFQEERDKGAFLEWANVHGNFYGTHLTQIQKTKGVLLLDLDVQGCDRLKELVGDQSHIIFISPPSLEELEKRLKARQTETPESMARRLKNAEQEILRRHDFDNLIINEDLEQCYQELKTLVGKLIGDS